MAAKKNGSKVVDTEFKEVEAPKGGYDLAARRPTWEPGDGIAMKGLLLGTQNLPSDIAGQEHWRVFVVQLTAPTMVHEKNEDGEETSRVAERGEYCLVTITSVLTRLEDTARDMRQVHEVYLKPDGVKKGKNGFEYNVFKHMTIANSFARTSATRLPSSPIPAQLPENASDASEIPF